MATSHIISQNGRMFLDDDDDTWHHGQRNNNNNNNLGRRRSENHYVTEPFNQPPVNNHHSYGARAPVSVARPVYSVRGADDSRFRTRGGFSNGLGAYPGPSATGESSRRLPVQSASLSPSPYVARRNLYSDSHVTAYQHYAPSASRSMNRQLPGKFVPEGNPSRRHSSSRQATTSVGLKYSASVQSVNRYQPPPPGANHVITPGRSQHQRHQLQSSSPPLIVVTSSNGREPLHSDRSNRQSVTSQIYSPGGTRLSPGSGQGLIPGGGSVVVQNGRSYTQPSRAAVADSSRLSASVAAPGNRRRQILSTTTTTTTTAPERAEVSNNNQQQQQGRLNAAATAPMIRQNSEVVYAAVRRKQVADNSVAAVNGVTARGTAADNDSIHARASSTELEDDVIDDRELQQQQQHHQLRRMNGIKSIGEGGSGRIGGRMEDGGLDVAVTKLHTEDSANRYVNGDVQDSRRGREEEVRDYNDEEEDTEENDRIEEGSWSGDVTAQQQQQQQQQEEHSYVNAGQANCGSILTADSDEEQLEVEEDGIHTDSDGEADEVEVEEGLQFGVHWLGSVAVPEEDLMEDTSRRQQLARCINLLHQLKHGSSQQAAAAEPACILQLTEDALDIVDAESANTDIVQSHQYMDIGYCQTGIDEDSSLFAYVVFDRHLGTVCHVIDCFTQDDVRRLVDALAPRFGCPTPSRDRPPRPPRPSTTLSATTTSSVVKSSTVPTTSSNRLVGLLRQPPNDNNNNNNGTSRSEAISSTLPVNHQNNDIRCSYIGKAQTSKQIGVKMITSKTSAAYHLVPRDRWAGVNLRVTSSAVYIVKLLKILDQFDVQDIKYAGINSNMTRLCGFVVKNKSRQDAIVHVFYCEQPHEAIQLCANIRAACEGRPVGANFDDRALSSLYTDQPGTSRQLGSTGGEYSRTLPPTVSTTIA